MELKQADKLKGIRSMCAAMGALKILIYYFVGWWVFFYGFQFTI